MHRSKLATLFNHLVSAAKQRERPLISSKAVNFEAAGQILSKFGSQAAREGDAIGFIIN